MTIASSPNPFAMLTDEQEFQRELDKYKRLCPDLEWQHYTGFMAWGLRGGKTVASLQMMRDRTFQLQVS